MKRLHLVPVFLLWLFYVACAASPTGPVTARVSTDGEGDYTTLEEAVAEVPAASTLILDATEYTLSEPLVISKSLTIQGAGVDATMITSSVGGFVLSFQSSGQWALSDLTVGRTAQYATNILFVKGGQMTLENCEVSGGAESDDQSILGSGLVLQNDAVATITNCRFVRNAGGGVVAVDSVSATMKEVTCSENGLGILFGGDATGVVQESTCALNQAVGVHLLGNAQVDLVDNLLRDNGGPGVLAELKSGGGKIQDNTFYENSSALDGADIRIYGASIPEISGNQCSNESDRDSPVFGGDLDGIVFMMFGQEDPEIPSSPNRCATAVCTGMSSFSMSCETLE